MNTKFNIDGALLPAYLDDHVPTIIIHKDSVYERERRFQVENDLADSGVNSSDTLRANRVLPDTSNLALDRPKSNKSPFFERPHLATRNFDSPNFDSTNFDSTNDDGNRNFNITHLRVPKTQQKPSSFKNFTTAEEEQSDYWEEDTSVFRKHSENSQNLNQPKSPKNEQLKFPPNSIFNRVNSPEFNKFFPDNNIELRERLTKLETILNLERSHRRDKSTSQHDLMNEFRWNNQQLRSELEILKHQMSSKQHSKHQDLDHEMKSSENHGDNKNSTNKFEQFQSDEKVCEQNHVNYQMPNGFVIKVESCKKCESDDNGKTLISMLEFEMRRLENALKNTDLKISDLKRSNARLHEQNFALKNDIFEIKNDNSRLKNQNNEMVGSMNDVIQKQQVKLDENSAVINNLRKELNFKSRTADFMTDADEYRVVFFFIEYQIHGTKMENLA